MKRSDDCKAARPGRAKPAVAACILAILTACASAGGADKPAAAASAPSSQPTAQPKPPADPHAKLLAQGWRDLEMVSYSKAQESFEMLLDRKPTRSQRAEALFALGHLWQYRRPGADVGEANKLYRQVATEFKDTPAAPLALLALGRLADAPEYEKDRKRAQARKLYQQVIATYPGHFAADEAVLRLAMTYLEEVGREKVEDTGAAMLTDYLAKKPDNLVAPVMHLQLGGLHQRRKEYPEAVRHWIASDEADEKAAAKIVDDIRHDNKYYISKISAERCRKLAAGSGGRASSRPAGGRGARP